MKIGILFILFGILISNLVTGQNEIIQESNLNKELVLILDSVYQEDQKYREEIQETETKYGWNSKEIKNLWKIIAEKDSINLIKVEKIINENGWLGSNVIGEKGNKTLFLVMQHADTKTQIKYLPKFREAVKNGNAKAEHLALMEDRVLIAQGKKQIYGSQLMTDPNTNEIVLFPMIHPEKVNERRKNIGLNSIEEYLENWDISWDLDKFQERMAKYDSKKINN
ncbi:MAG: DUF6624 domain-containing protein [Mangrovibacterium sp.]